MAPVHYASTVDRKEWLSRKIDAAATLIRNGDFPTEKLFLAAHGLLQRIKFFSLFTKHDGFKEEEEWRVVYMPERDKESQFHEMFNYAVGPHGIELKLRFKIRPIEGITPDDFSMTTLVDKIILGPSLSSVLAITAVRRMLEKNKKPELCERVFASSTPYRAR